VKQRAEELNIKTVVVASTAGNTAAKATEVLSEFKIIAVSHFTGFKAPDSQQFTEENKMINSTLKMVRYKIIEAYQQDIAEMYESGRSATISPKNMETIKNLLPFH